MDGNNYLTKEVYLNTQAKIVKKMNAKWEGLIDLIYPIGSIYESVSNIDPNEVFGGTWERYGNGKVLVAVDETDTDFATIDKSGGEKKHQLTEAELASHKHSANTVAINETAFKSGGWNAMRSAERSIAQYANNYVGTEYTNSTGSNQAHNNLQPFLMCYRWVRRA